MKEVIKVSMPDDDFIAGRIAMEKGIPWILPEAMHWLHRFLSSRPGFRVFEWGSGGSTEWFCKMGGKVVSVEMKLRWYLWTLERLKPHRDSLLVFAPFFASYVDEYADAIKAYRNGWFDVDGEMEARERCLKNAIEKLKPDGVMLLDNSNWSEAEAVRKDGWQETMWATEPYQWLGEENTWATSIFHRMPDV